MGLQKGSKQWHCRSKLDRPVTIAITCPVLPNKSLHSRCLLHPMFHGYLNRALPHSPPNLSQYQDFVYSVSYTLKCFFFMLLKTLLIQKPIFNLCHIYFFLSVSISAHSTLHSSVFPSLRQSHFLFSLSLFSPLQPQCLTSLSTSTSASTLLHITIFITFSIPSVTLSLKECTLVE